MLKIGCTSPNLANICLSKPTDANFYPSTASDEDLLEKIHGDKVGGPSIVFTRKTFVGKTLTVIRQTSTNPMLEVALFTLILSLCVKRCPLVYLQDES